jgi:hypothetical protein
MKDKCEKCVFYLAATDDGVEYDDYGVCRRYPPELVDDEEGFSSEYPPVQDNDWCGEFVHQVGRRDIPDEDEEEE